MERATKPPQASTASTRLFGRRHSRPNQLDPVLTRSSARSWIISVTVLCRVSCCWLLALNVTTWAAVGEKTVAVGVTNGGNEAADRVNVTLLLTWPLKVI